MYHFWKWPIILFIYFCANENEPWWLAGTSNSGVHFKNCSLLLFTSFPSPHQVQIVSPERCPHRMQIVTIKIVYFGGHVALEARRLINFCVSLISSFRSLSSHLSWEPSPKRAPDSVTCRRDSSQRSCVKFSVDFRSDLSNVPHHRRLKPWPFATKGLLLITCVAVMHHFLKKKQRQVSKWLAVRATPAF